MKIDENVTVYKCDHCKKKLFREHAMVKHEQFCSNNPENTRACSSCAHIENKKIQFYFEDPDYFEGQAHTMCNAFYCEKIKSFIYPPSIEKRQFYKENPMHFGRQLPWKKDCSYYQGLGSFDDIGNP